MVFLIIGTSVFAGAGVAAAAGRVAGTGGVASGVACAAGSSIFTFPLSTQTCPAEVAMRVLSASSRRTFTFAPAGTVVEPICLPFITSGMGAGAVRMPARSGCPHAKAQAANIASASRVLFFVDATLLHPQMSFAIG